jgi:hypothetical protein
MSEIKMSDVFNMPFVLYEGNIWCSGTEQVRPNKKEMHLRAFSMCDDSDRLTIIKDAINSHDKLTEQNKMLREALARLTCWGAAFNNADELDDYEDVATVQSNFNDELINAESILEKTK